jgi:hypothetical protein
MLEGPDTPIRDMIKWYKSLYVIPGKLLVWIGVIIVLVTLVAWITHDNTPKAKPKQIRMTKGIAASNRY